MNEFKMSNSLSLLEGEFRESHLLDLSKHLKIVSDTLFHAYCNHQGRGIVADVGVYLQGYLLYVLYLGIYGGKGQMEAGGHFSSILVQPWSAGAVAGGHFSSILVQPWSGRLRSLLINPR